MAIGKGIPSVRCGTYPTEHIQISRWSNKYVNTPLNINISITGDRVSRIYGQHKDLPGTYLPIFTIKTIFGPICYGPPL